eukprot:CAMPEP_0119135060 /NCGR_PEP_ID=MMETSP1310-20130426/18560_1 /TAXON_ID=464262 /ORGANISM="Genus nov. species nov., Strain RCC2339" /LENGTH=540 /DNA_ID=CAMNT_0007125913 /DNA_START=23 /DNA_END=1642 /DNA_ORIENTATION=+
MPQVVLEEIPLDDDEGGEEVVTRRQGGESVSDAGERGSTDAGGKPVMVQKADRDVVEYSRLPSCFKLSRCHPPVHYYGAFSMAGLSLAFLVNGALRSAAPTAFKALAKEFGLSASKLGTIPFFRNLVAAAVLPFCGYLSDRFSRRRIVTWSMLYLAILTTALAFTTSYWSFLTIRTLSGLAFDFLLPISASYIGDYYRRDKRGIAFAVIAVFATLGNLGGTMMMGSLASESLMNTDGWRVVFVILGVASLASAVSSWFLLFDPQRGTTELEKPSDAEQRTEVGEEESEIRRIDLSQVKEIFHNMTLIVLMVCGTLYTIPWVGFNFLLYWFQLAGLTDVEASATYGMAAVGFLLGNIGGGLCGDRVSKLNAVWAQDYGRIMVAQISLCIALPLLTMLLVVFDGMESFPFFLIMTVVIAFFLSWPEQAADNPMLTESSHPDVRGTAIGLAFTVIGVLSSVGSLLVGVISEWYGFRELGPDEDIADIPSADRDRNRDALAYSLLTVSLLFWGSQIIVYFVLYRLYPAQRDRIHAALREAENAV